MGVGGVQFCVCGESGAHRHHQEGPSFPCLPSCSSLTVTPFSTRMHAGENFTYHDGQVSWCRGSLLCQAGVFVLVDGSHPSVPPSWCACPHLSVPRGVRILGGRVLCHACCSVAGIQASSPPRMHNAHCSSLAAPLSSAHTVVSLRVAARHRLLHLLLCGMGYWRQRCGQLLRNQ